MAGAGAGGGTEAALILVGDADPARRRHLRVLMEAGGDVVQEAADGEALLDLVAAAVPAAVVVDATMPGALEACTRLRDRAAGVPILMLVGDEEPEAVDKALAAGAADFASRRTPDSMLSRRMASLRRSTSVLFGLRRSEVRLALAQRTARLGYWERDFAKGSLAWSLQMHAILGTDPAAFVPSPAAYLELLHPQDRDPLTRTVEDARQRRVPYGIELRVMQPNGGVRLVREQGEPLGGVSTAFMGTVQDISVLFYDPTTRLPNSKLFQDRLSVAIAQSQVGKTSLALLIIDLDRFRSIDSALGREAADAVLETIARRVESCVGPGDTVARIGGDEFAILLPRVASMEQAAELGLRVMDGIKQPLLAAGREIFVTATVGMGVFPRDGADAESLLANATAATYAAKEKGQESLRRYTARLNAKDVQRVLIESGLRRGLERGELVLHYQPIIDVATGRALHVEALLRWQKQDGTLVAPAEFIPVIETSGLMIAIDSWVIRTACKEIASLNGAGERVAVSVNLSARQLHQADVEVQVRESLAASSLPAWRLGIEITEGTAMQDVARSIETLRGLRTLGLRIAVDDFGTGYSSLSYLQRLPLDTVKLDRAFVREIETNPDDAAIATAVIAMSHSLGLTVVAEGVETLGQFHHLERQGCDAIQGFLVSPAVPVDLLREMLLRGGSLLPAGAEPFSDR